jgi:CRP-like cAMP-binding protein
LKIAKICKPKAFPKDTYIIKAGDKGNELYIILKGTVNVVNKTLQNEEYVVNSLKGEWGGLVVGEVGLLKADRTASVITETPCEALVITSDDFYQLGDENNELGLKITRRIALKLAENLNKANKDVITLFSALVDEISDEK